MVSEWPSIHQGYGKSRWGTYASFLQPSHLTWQDRDWWVGDPEPYPHRQRSQNAYDALMHSINPQPDKKEIRLFGTRPIGAHGVDSRALRASL
jgi:hypothetical protein